MDKWELARYLIDAKKCVDGVIFVDQNRTLLSNINLRDRVNEKRRIFYINCCVVLDRSFPKQKKKICSSDAIIERIYYERDKNYAHKDPDYVPIEYKSIGDIADDMKRQLCHLRDLCSASLPEVITLDFVPYDKDLYRQAHGLTAEKESSLEGAKYPNRDTCADSHSVSRQIFDDTEDIRSIDYEAAHRYATVAKNGITTYEGLHERQDFCIKTNVLHGLDTWCGLNPETNEMMRQLEELGIVDEYGIFHPDVLTDEKVQEKLEKILNNEIDC